MTIQQTILSVNQSVNSAKFFENLDIGEFHLRSRESALYEFSWEESMKIDTNDLSSVIIQLQDMLLKGDSLTWIQRQYVLQLQRRMNRLYEEMINPIVTQTVANERTRVRAEQDRQIKERLRLADMEEIDESQSKPSFPFNEC